MKLLHIDAGITGEASISRQLSATIVEAIRGVQPDTDIVRRDLDAAPVPHLTSATLGSLGADPEMAEFLAADVLVIGAPMYNFSIPSQLKAWFDRVLVAGKTFRYGAEGPVGLAGGKTVIVALTRGGVYSEGTAMAALDFQEPYLRTMFRFIGIEDVIFVRAEGLAMSEHRKATLDAAKAAAQAIGGQLRMPLAA